MTTNFGRGNLWWGPGDSREDGQKYSTRGRLSRHSYGKICEGIPSREPVLRNNSSPHALTASIYTYRGLLVLPGDKRNIPLCHPISLKIRSRR